ncbi:MAG: hypothetical protein ACREAG_01790 [Nitrosopumilaceae archaeon]
MGLASLVALLAIFPLPTFAEQQTIDTEFASADDLLVLEKRVIPMNIPADNKLPWGFIEGKVFNHAEGRPVIIQIYKDDKPVHFAQADVKEDGSYEYKFRARNVNDDHITNIYQGDYTVKIFKTVYLDSAYIEYLANLEKQNLEVSIQPLI